MTGNPDKIESHCSHAAAEVCVCHLYGPGKRRLQANLPPKTRVTASPIRRACGKLHRPNPLLWLPVCAFGKFHPRFNTRLQFTVHHPNSIPAV
jgi:hypothetical protein